MRLLYTALCVTTVIDWAADRLLRAAGAWLLSESTRTTRRLVR